MAMTPGRNRRMRTWAVIGVVLLVLAVLGARALSGPRVAVARVERRPLVQKIVANGRVDVPVRVQLGVQVGGAVARLLVDKGDSVQFERKTPFGVNKWTRRKAELSGAERLAYEKAVQGKAATATAKPAQE